MTNYASVDFDLLQPIKQIIDRYYPESENPELRHILITHSTLVARKALALAARHPELPIDTDFVCKAAMLHDIGIFKCDAPAIHCHGNEPYLCHGILGARLMRDEGFPRYARVCERHTGAGLTISDIELQNLPLPHKNLIPETLEEKLICYADKFYSKTHLTREKTFEKALLSMERFGEDSVKRFLQMKELFE